MGLLKDIKDFVGKYIKNPLIISGIAYIVYKLLSSKKENLEEYIRVLHKEDDFEIIFDSESNSFTVIDGSEVVDKVHPVKSLGAGKELIKRLKLMNKTNMEAKTVGGYESPEPGDLPKHLADILAQVYASARKAGDDKEKAAKKAWGAVNRAQGKESYKKLKILHERIVLKEKAIIPPKKAMIGPLQFDNWLHETQEGKELYNALHNTNDGIMEDDDNIKNPSKVKKALLDKKGIQVSDEVAKWLFNSIHGINGFPK